MVRVTALALTALTGFTALVYEVAWQKYVATLLGSHSEATAAVLALFLGGLSAGYALFGSITLRVVTRAREQHREPRLLLLYGCVEGSIGLHALAFPWLVESVRAISLAVPHQVSGLGFAFDVCLVALLVLPPTVLMGGTIPVLTQALSRNLGDSTRLHALVYAWNTAGAFAGAMLAGYLLIPSFGLALVVRSMGALNLVAGTTFAVLGLLHRGALGYQEQSDAAPGRLGSYAIVALLSGFGAMALQTVLIRTGGLALGSSEFTFSMVVSVFVLCIALGSFVVAALPRIPRATLFGVQTALVAILAGLYVAVGNAPYWAYVVRVAFRDELVGFYFFQLMLFILVLAVLLLPVGLSGATLPLIFHELRRQFGGLGSSAGRLYAWNTAGSLLGALLGGYLLLFWIDLDRVYTIAVVAFAVSAVLVGLRTFGGARKVALVGLPLLALPLLQPRWNPLSLSAGLFRQRMPQERGLLGPAAALDMLRSQRDVIFYDDDPTSSVAVMVHRQASDALARHLAIVTNGKPDGSTQGDYPTMALAAMVPALLAERPQRAFVIGFGTGVTVGELAALDDVEEVTVAEISPAVIEAAPLFEGHNQGALASPKTRVIVSDAYRSLQTAEGTYDIIVSEPSNPWVTGVEMLYSRDFLLAARERLSPGGIYAQWFHLYEMNDDVVSLVLRTFGSVFDNISIWRTMETDILLIGYMDPERASDLDEVERRAARPEIAAALARAGVVGMPALLAHEVLPVGIANSLELEGDVHTLAHPILSHRAAQAFFVGHSGDFPTGAGVAAAEIASRTSLLQEWVRRSGGVSDAEYGAIARELCESEARRCASLLARWRIDHPDSADWQRVLEGERKKPLYKEHLQPDRLEDLELLYGGRPLPAGRVQVADAKRLTELYAYYYYHAFPFDRLVPTALWQRCQDERQGLECLEARRIAEERLGSFGRAVGTARPGVGETASRALP